MRSESADLTATARIRDAAVRRFGAEGFARTSVREIAADAGVSPALVIHHFGSKQGLRDACDAWVLALLNEKRADAAPARAGATIASWLAQPEQFGPLIDYIAAMLRDDSEHSRRLFALLVDETRAMLDEGVADGTMNDSDDPEARALLITLQGLAPVLLRSHLERALGGGLLDAGVLARLTIPSLELHTHGLYSDTRMLDAARGALAQMGGTPAQKEQK